MKEARRIKPDEARRKVQAGEALLVCAYESEGTCSGPLKLEGSMTLGEFNTRLDSITKEQEIIFYCK